MKRLTELFINLGIFFVILCLGLLLSELLLRVRNSDQSNYNIEMWRYAKLLKVRSTDSLLGHEHKLNSKARLEKVDIRINNLGMRGEKIDLKNVKKKILFLGSSNTLGWGVPEDETMCSVVGGVLKTKAVVLNGGIGNYNASRYVRLFEKKYRNLKPDIVVINYFIRDAEHLDAGGGNFLLRNSELAVVFYHMFQNLLHGYGRSSRLVDHYAKVYSEDSAGLKEMEQALAYLNKMSRQDGFKVVFTMLPDVHAIKPYPFTSIHQQIHNFVKNFGWIFIDFTQTLSRVPAEELWIMKGDPHINGKGQKMMAQEMLPYLNSLLV